MDGGFRCCAQALATAGLVVRRFATGVWGRACCSEVSIWQFDSRRHFLARALVMLSDNALSSLKIRPLTAYNQFRISNEQPISDLQCSESDARTNTRQWR